MKIIENIDDLILELEPKKDLKLEVMWRIECDPDRAECDNAFIVCYFDRGYREIVELGRRLMYELLEEFVLEKSHFVLDCQDYYKHYYVLNFKTLVEISQY